MIPKFTTEDYNNTKSTHKLLCECEECHKDFKIEKRYITRVLINDPKFKNTGRFCSKECKNKHRQIRVELKCHQCGTIFYTQPSKVERNNHNFCSNKCFKTYKEFRRSNVFCDACGKPVSFLKSKTDKAGKHYCDINCYNKKRVMRVATTCHNCGKELKRVSSRVKLGKQFCSLKCFHVFSLKRVDLFCDYCGKPMIKKECNIKNNVHHFCSSSCTGKYNAEHKTWGCGRSKLEKWIEPQLQDFYPELEFHFNRNDTINSELDIYIPSLKLAFELNGVFHYEPIFGAELLNKISNNDKRKFQACLERGIELCVINNNSMRTFNEKKAVDFMQIITNIIDCKLNNDA